MNIALIDNNDSFTYNLVDILRKMQNIKFHILPYHTLQTVNFDLFDSFIISPGPDTPDKYPMLHQVINDCIHKSKPLLGVCLGYQSICQFFDGNLIQLNTIVHGQQKKIDIDTASTLFKNLPTQIKVGLYHSWIIDSSTLPNCLKITAMGEYLMAVEHIRHKIYGLQFHPESFMSEYGDEIIKNFLDISWR